MAILNSSPFVFLRPFSIQLRHSELSWISEKKESLGDISTSKKHEKLKHPIYVDVVFVTEKFCERHSLWLVRNYRVKWFQKEHSCTLYTLHKGAFCQFPFRWIYYCHRSKSTGKETGKMWQILKRHQSLAYKFLTHALIYQLSAKCRRIMILLDTITKTVKVVCLVCFSKQPEILKLSIAHLFPALRAFWFLEKTAFNTKIMLSHFLFF